MIDLKKTKAICDGATAGPWVAEAVMTDDATDVVLSYQVPKAGNPVVVASAFGGAELDCKEGTQQAAKDAMFMAHARSALPELVEWAERAQPALAEAARCLWSKNATFAAYLESLAGIVSGARRPRKAVQVAIDETGVAVVADDGTLWFLASNDCDCEWRKFQPLPPREDESEQEEA